jgi:type II secretion system protein G
MPAKLRAAHERAFTLVEILIVVVILGILAAIVVPQFTSAAATTRENSTKMDLHRMRIQLELYKEQHNGSYPSLANFVEQMTLASNALGVTAPVGTSGYPLGPYITAVPVNPRLPSNSVSDGAIGSSGWYYNEATGELRANDSAESALW